MSREDKEKQVGALMYELKKATGELAAQKARKAELERRLTRIVQEWENLGVTYKTAPSATSVPTLIRPGTTEWEEVTLPTTEELVEVFHGVSSAESECARLRTSLIELGFKGDI